MDKATRDLISRQNEIKTLQDIVIDYHLTVSLGAYNVKIIADMKEKSERAQMVLKVQYGVTSANHIYWD